jgi:iron(III) transport system substrate-binding protein
MPGAADPQNWKDQKLKWMDPEGQYLLQTTEAVGSGITVNPEAIPPASITSWRDLLKPEYKGKIAAFDPRLEGVGLATATYLYIKFGEDYVKQLYLDQAVLTGDERQLAEWVGRKVYPIGVSLVPRQTEVLSGLGLKFERVYPPDGPGHLVGGASLISMPKGRPHPNAGIVLANWLVSKDGQVAYTNAVKDVSRRTDVPVVAPAYLVPKPGLDYLDTYDTDFWLTVRVQTVELVRKALGT